MPDILKRLSAPLTFGGLILLAIVTMVADRRGLQEGGRDLSWWQGIVLEVAIPIQKLVAAPVDALRGTWSDYVDLIGVRQQNERLRARVSELEDQNLQYREALVASGHLDRIAAMRDDFETPMLPSEVVGLDVSPWFQSILIDRGSSHGVRAGHPVITHQGVVGLVTRTSPHAAKTMLLLDRQSAIDAVVQRSRSRGLVRGTGTDELDFEFVASGSDVEPGDVVITSGLAGVYPKGLQIGEVVEVEEAEGRLMRVARVRPAVDFGRLEQVFVMLRRGPSMKLLYEGNAPESVEPEVDPGEARPKLAEPAVGREEGVARGAG